MVSLPEDPVKLHLDSWAVKKLFSLALRRSGKDKDAEGTPQRKAQGCRQTRVHVAVRGI